MPANELTPTQTEIDFHSSAKRLAARYVSATTVYEEALEHGRWIGLYWSAGGQVQRENTAAGLPALDSLALPLHTFELEVDGQSLHNHWEWVGASRRPGDRLGILEAVVELRHKVRPITLKVVTRLDGSPILVRYLEITNTGGAPAALSHVTPFAGMIWSTPKHPIEGNTRLMLNPSCDESKPAYRVAFLAGDRWGEEGDLAWQEVGRGTFRLERRARGRVFGPPYFIAENRVTGQRFFLALGWSGNFVADFTGHDEGHLSLRVGPQAPAPLRVIAPGETVTSPWVHMGPLHGTLDGAVAAWYDHVRRGVAPPRPRGKEIYTIAGRVVEEPGPWILREIDIAAEMGVEAFMVDAGWYGEKFGSWTELRGDWHEGDWLPGGIAGIRDYCHRKGLLFGLWHEAEAITAQSRLGKEHPDWVLKTDENRSCGPTLDLANPDAARFFEETVIRLIRDHRLDFYKLDYNVDVREGGQTFRDGLTENEAWRHHEVVHRTYDRARREFPHVCLENCASGGGRNDIGMLARFHYMCESDWSVHPIAIRAINAMTLFIPPECLCYYHNHVNWGAGKQAHMTADAPTHLRVALFALPIFVGFGAQDADRGSNFHRLTKRYIDLHKGFCRPILADHPVVYHHTPDIGVTASAPWCVLEYAGQDRGRGYAGVFKLSHGAASYLFRPRGADPAADYEVTLDNTGQTYRIPGRELARGLSIDLDAALTSELVMYRRL